MLRRVDELLGFRIHAADGDIGRVHDLYFDDQRWTVRYLVVDTRHWLPGPAGAAFTGLRASTGLGSSRDRRGAQPRADPAQSRHR